MPPVNTLKAEIAYERTPTPGIDGLRFPLERYLPRDNCIDLDADLLFKTRVKHMSRSDGEYDLCFRCGRSNPQHPKALCNCQWCGGAADDGHPDLECPWIYITVYTWKSKITARDSSRDNIKTSQWVPRNVQIKPTKEEQAILAGMDPRFIDFPYPREGHEVKIPDGVTMRRPARMPTRIPASLPPTYRAPAPDRKRQRDNADYEDEPTRLAPKRFKDDHGKSQDEFVSRAEFAAVKAELAATTMQLEEIRQTLRQVINGQVGSLHGMQREGLAFSPPPVYPGNPLTAMYHFGTGYGQEPGRPYSGANQYWGVPAQGWSSAERYSGHNQVPIDHRYQYPQNQAHQSGPADKQSGLPQHVPGADLPPIKQEDAAASG